MIKTVIKRDGTREEFDVDKLNKWAEWASQECGVAWSDILFDAVRALNDDVATENIHDAMIETCLSRRDTGHAKMAARLLLGKIYKEAFTDAKIPKFKTFYKSMVKQQHWDDLGYTDVEIDELEKIIDHGVDFTYAYATLKQFYDKYAISVDNKVFESPQFAMMGIAMSNMRNEPNDRLKQVISLYQDLSDLKLNLPTPSLNGERTPLLGSPSCCLISGGDQVPSMGAATHVAYTMTAQRSGIGTEFETRGPGDPVKNGRIKHAGKFAYYNYLDRAVKANTQVTRGGSATVTFTCLDPEVFTLLGLKSTRVDEDSRIDKMDYSFAMHHLFLKKVATNDDWMLVSPYYAPKLYKLFYEDKQEQFEKEYTRLLEDDSVKKKIVKARDVAFSFINYRNETGRIYALFISNVNKHTPFKEEIRQSNLCQEILLHTAAYDDMPGLYNTTGDSAGEVALCFIGSIVAGRIKTDEEYESATYNLCKFIDNTTEDSVYPFPQVEYTAKKRRSIGVGLTDVAHWMAMNGYRYDTLEGRKAIHRLAERHSYFLHKASVRLAKERGACEWMHKTKYANDKPWLPIDTYNKAIDEYVDNEQLHYDWKGLRKEIKEFGVRFSVHEAYMPVESSSVFTNSTNGTYPVRKEKVYKGSRKGSVYFQLPELDELRNKYQFAWDIKTEDMVKFYAVIQKFTGQAISSDFYHDYERSPKISQKETLQNLLLAAKIGMKTWYYLNFKVSTDAAKREAEHESGAINFDEVAKSPYDARASTQSNTPIVSSVPYDSDEDGDEAGDCCKL